LNFITSIRDPAAKPCQQGGKSDALDGHSSSHPARDPRIHQEIRRKRYPAPLAAKK